MKRVPAAGRAVIAFSGAALLLGTSACAFEETVFSSVADDEDDRAEAISAPADSDLFRSGGTGPDRVNTDADEGDPLGFVDPDTLTEDGGLPSNITATEAQSLQVLGKLATLLADEGISFADIATVRAYLTTGPDGADYDGWEKAYRKFFANIDPNTGESLVTPTAATVTKAETPATTTSAQPTSEPADTTEPSETDEPDEPTESTVAGDDNRTKPSVVTVGVADQPVEGWLVQVEVEAISSTD
ncbi:MAG: hypothetical protein ACTH1D_12490 [Mycobacteriaceae bacterium]